MKNESVHKDKLPGGLADKKDPKDFDQKQLAKGIKVELEHTSDETLAQEIAMDHLTEDPMYYEKLEKMEKAKKESVNRYLKALVKEEVQKALKEAVGDVVPAGRYRSDVSSSEALKDQLQDKMLEAAAAYFVKLYKHLPHEEQTRRASAALTELEDHLVDAMMSYKVPR